MKAKDLEIGGAVRLWAWFGLGRSAFLVLPRVAMQDMPNEWQSKMADLLEEYEATFPNQPDIETQVTCVKKGRFAAFPAWVLNYRRPDREALKSLRQPHP